jgi:hypothetical protein
MERFAWMRVHLRSDQQAAPPQFSVKGRHSSRRDMKHVGFGSLRRKVGILDRDHTAIASSQPEHHALAAAFAGFKKPSESTIDQDGRTGGQHSDAPFLPSIPQLGENAPERVARAVF